MIAYKGPQLLGISAMDDLLQHLKAIVSPAHVLTEATDMAPHLTEWRDLYQGRARAVVKPGSAQEVAAIVKLASTTKTPIVPQGGNTGLVGGGVPDQSGREIILSVTRLNRIRTLDAANSTMTVEAGMTLQAAQDAAERQSLLFPLSLASEGSCTIGGNLATNAGGTAVLTYGNMRDLTLGLEVVLADGAIWNGLRRLRKDNTGYDLKNLFIGAEGTLGIITAAVLKLYPRPRSRETVFAGVPSPQAALALFQRMRNSAGQMLTAAEILPRFGIELVTRHIPGARDPFPETHPWYVLLEVSSTAPMALRPLVEETLAAALDAGEIRTAAIAESLDQRTMFWRLREAMSEAQKCEGGSIKHDVSVPLSDLPAFTGEAIRAAEKTVPGCRPLPFGHLGDGNLHFNVSQPLGMEKSAFLAQWDAMNEAVHAVALKYDGSIAAEHGVGRLKGGLIARVKDATELRLMRGMKNTLDPDNILNPGVMLPDAKD